MSSPDQFSTTLEYQTKLISYMLHSPQFCAIAAEALQEEHFSNKALQWFYDTLSNTKPHLSEVTLREELLSAAKNKSIREDEIAKYIDLFTLAKTPPTPEEEEYIQGKMGAFVRTQSVKRAILNSFDLIKEEKWSEITDDIVEATNAGVDVLSMGTNYFGDLEDRISDRINKPESRKLQTGIPDLDSCLYGGLKNKQLGLIIGGTGRGKSIFLEWLARIGILLGKKVVYFTMELSEEDVADRFDSMFAYVRPQELATSSATVLQKVNPLASKFGNSLMIKEYPADSATINTLKTYLRQLTAAGIVPDLVLVDYLDLMRPHRTYSSTHDELDAITKSLHGLSKEFNTRVWTATQMNRSGLVMDTPDESTISGAVAKLYTCDVALWMAQTKEEREDESMRIWISKNRNGPAGRTISLDTDYSYMTFYRAPKDVDDGRDKDANSTTG